MNVTRSINKLVIYADTQSLTFTFLLPTPTLSVGVGRMFEFVCLSVCLFVCPEHNSKINDPKFSNFIGIGNDLEIPYKWNGFGVEKPKVKG